jgi:hypothetical protein
MVWSGNRELCTFSRYSKGGFVGRLKAEDRGMSPEEIIPVKTKVGKSSTQDRRPQQSKDYESDGGTGSFFGEPGTPPRDFANRPNATPVNTGRVEVGALVVPPTPGGEE